MSTASVMRGPNDGRFTFERVDLRNHLDRPPMAAQAAKTSPLGGAFGGTSHSDAFVSLSVRRHPGETPTIGLLLCREKNRLVVEYSLRYVNKPIGVAEWERRASERDRRSATRGRVRLRGRRDRAGRPDAPAA